MNSRSINYDGIIATEYPFELKHIRMNISGRAAQFSAFQTLSGFEAEIQETVRFTDKQVELDESHKDILNAKLKRIREKRLSCRWPKLYTLCQMPRRMAENI